MTDAFSSFLAAPLAPSANTPEPAKVRRSPFSANIPTWQIAWDSTSLGLFKECPRKYMYQMVLGYQPRGTNMHLFFGQLYHHGLEVYDHACCAGEDHDTATRSMVRAVLLRCGAYTEDGIWSPWDSGDNIKNSYTLLRSLVWYVEHFRGTGQETVTLANGKPAVELSFNFAAFDVEGESVSLCGHMDRLIRMDDRVWVGDRKTTKGALGDSYYRGFAPHNQFTLYSVASKIALDIPVEGVMVDACQIGVGFTRFGQRPSPRPQAVLDEWLGETEWWITQARSMAIAESWPANDKSCGNYGGCSFAGVCNKSPTFRKAWLESDFGRWRWNPLEVRGDI